MNRLQHVCLIALCVVVHHESSAEAAPKRAGRPFKGALAVQLWSFRADFKKDVPGTLKRVRELGFTNVELAGTYGMSAAEFRAALDRAGLRAISMHVDYQTVRDHTDKVISD